MGVVESLAVWGIQRPAQMVEAATTAGLDLPVAAALLEQESAGGHNVWGHDRVDSGGYYTPGAEVTQAAYVAWRPHRARLGSQGVGPCQLTWPPLQDQADRAGGCWDPAANMQVGFAHLSGLIRRWGLTDAVRRYNGSGPAADRYRDQMLDKIGRWRARLGTPNLEVDVPLAPDERAALLAILESVHALKPGVALPGRGPAAAGLTDDHYGWTLNGAGWAAEALSETRQLTGRLDALASQVALLRGGGVDPADLADRVVDELVARLSTGPVTEGTP